MNRGSIFFIVYIEETVEAFLDFCFGNIPFGGDSKGSLNSHITGRSFRRIEKLELQSQTITYLIVIGGVPSID